LNGDSFAHRAYRALTYRDHEMLARDLPTNEFFCSTSAKPFFRPDRSSTAPSCRAAPIELQRFDTTLHRLLPPFAWVLAFLIASVINAFVNPIVGGAGLVVTMAGVLVAYLSRAARQAFG
jgi:hypothetical protein